MTLYKRIPKTLWQRVWFKFRPQVVEAEKFYNDGWIYSVHHKDHFHNYWAEKFEANYEPVLCEHQKAWRIFNLSPKIDICPVCNPKEYKKTLEMKYEPVSDTHVGEMNHSVQKNEPVPNSKAGQHGIDPPFCQEGCKCNKTKGDA